MLDKIFNKIKNGEIESVDQLTEAINPLLDEQYSKGKKEGFDGSVARRVSDVKTELQREYEKKVDALVAEHQKELDKLNLDKSKEVEEVLNKLKEQESIIQEHNLSQFKASNESILKEFKVKDKFTGLVMNNVEISEDDDEETRKAKFEEYLKDNPEFLETAQPEITPPTVEKEEPKFNTDFEIVFDE